MNAFQAIKVTQAISRQRCATRAVWGQLSMINSNSIVSLPVQMGRRNFHNSRISLSELKEGAVISEKPDSASSSGTGEHIVVGDDGIPRNVKNIDDPPSEKLNVLIDKILDLDIIEMNQLLNRLQNRLGITDEMIVRSRAGGGGGGGGGGGDGGGDEAEAVVEKTAFDVKLTGFDPKSKIKIIKEVRAATGLGLKEAKDLVESAPCVIKEGLTKDEADALNKLITELGGTIEVL